MRGRREVPRTGEEPKMRVRDADLRALIYEYGAGPGSDLHEALAELQERRDAEGAASRPGRRAQGRRGRSSGLL